jgi:hypothetical protein
LKEIKGMSKHRAQQILYVMLVKKQIMDIINKQHNGLKMCNVENPHCLYAYSPYVLASKREILHIKIGYF